MKLARLFRGVGIAIVITGAASAAHAQDVKPPVQVGGLELEEVTVNARRVKENLQSVPIAVTAVSEATLQKQDIRTFQDLGMRTPGLDVCCSRGSTGLIWMRGVPGVVGYFSEIPVDLNGAGLFFDVSNM